MPHAGELQARVGRRLFLEGNRAGQQAPVEFGQHDIHGEIRRRQATAGLRPGRAFTARQHDLQHRHVGAIEHRRVVLPHRREGCGVEHNRRPARVDQRLQRRFGCRVLQAVERHGHGCQALPVERCHQRFDRRHVASHQIGTIEHDQRGGPWILSLPQHREGADRCGFLPGQGRTDQARGITQRIAQIFDSALPKEALEQIARDRRDRRHRGEARIGPFVARQGGEQHAILARQIGKALQTVAPVVDTSQAARDHDLRPRCDAVDVEVDRHRVLQLPEIGEPQGRQPSSVALPRRRQGRQIAVRE